MDLFLHNSRMSLYRTPLGACPAGTRVRLFCRAEGRFSDASVTLELWEEPGGARFIPMARVENGFSAEFELMKTPGLTWYSFRIVFSDGGQLRYGGRSGTGFLSENDPGSFRITVYDGAFDTPRWFREGICYQIFPDRFRRSSWEDFYARQSAHTSLGRKIRVHDRWSEEPESTAEPGEKDYAPNDYFGGDLNGIRSRLPYLASLGVTCLYLNPVFSAASNHRYNTADYMHIDPLLGTDEEFGALCREARALGIRIMTDGVFSHTGSDSVYFNREGRYGTGGAYRDEHSPYRSWYRFREDGTYECWWDFVTLPNVEELDPGYSAFIMGDNGVLCRWAAEGSTSWRLDVADELPDEFIRRLRKRVKQNDPEGVLLGEVWEEPTAKRGPEGRRGYVNGDELDSVMNYCFKNAVLDFLTGKTDASAMRNELLFLEEQYPRPFYLAALNLLSSHDVVRALTVLADAPDRDALSREEQRVWAPSPEARARAKRRMVLAEAIQVFLPGVPCLYYGDEAGMEGMADPFNRKPFPWGKEDPLIFAETKKLFALRRDSAVLKRGACRMSAPDAKVFAAVRSEGEERLLLLVNGSEEERTVTLENAAFIEGCDGGDGTFTGSRWEDEAGNAFALSDGTAVTLPPLSYRILKELG